MNNEEVTATLKQMNIIYLALIAGQVLFASIAYFLAMEDGNVPDDAELGILGMIVPIVCISTIGGSYFIYNMLVQKGQTLEGLDTKINHYRSSNIVRWALVEGGNLFAIVVFLLSGATHILAFFALGLAVFFLYRPSQDRFANDYDL